jgi:hypothetical protein
MLRHWSRSIFTISFVLMLTALCAGAMAQSGRRTPKTKPAPVPVPESAPAPAKPAEPKKPALTLVVGMDTYRGLTFNDILNSCADRLDDNRSVKVVVDSSGMTRGDAIRRAKKETEAYVVWLQLSTDSMSGELGSGGNYLLDYWVFAPVTAKRATSGGTYASARRNRGVILNPRRSGIYGDYELQQAAREAAEKILSALHHPLPPRNLPNPFSR